MEDQKIKVKGFLGADSKYKETDNGKKLCEFSVASNDDKEDTTTWYNVVVWNENADLAKQLKKGQFVSVEGYLKKETYTNKEGVSNTRDYLSAYSLTIGGEKLRGILGSDVLVHQYDSGKRIAKFSIADNSTGETIWHNVEAWDDHVSEVENLKKGDLVEVEGKVKTIFCMSLKAVKTISKKES